VGISRDYPRKTRTSKQPIVEIPGYEIIPSHPLKYPRSKQGLNVYQSYGTFQLLFGIKVFLKSSPAYLQRYLYTIKDEIK
jgi:hypothetical protein